jgi:hypothetical protein
MKSHPAAECYRLMTEEELAGLAEDIAVNGLVDPIVVVAFEGEDVVVDGRNRLAACKMAGVEPRFERLDPRIDPRDFVWTRGQRRNVSKGQQAIAFALLWPEPDKPGRGKKGKASETDGFSATRLKNARAIVNHSRELAFAVRYGNEIGAIR